CRRSAQRHVVVGVYKKTSDVRIVGATRSQDDGHTGNAIDAIRARHVVDRGDIEIAVLDVIRAGREIDVVGLVVDRDAAAIRSRAQGYRAALARGEVRVVAAGGRRGRSQARVRVGNRRGLIRLRRIGQADRGTGRVEASPRPDGIHVRARARQIDRRARATGRGGAVRGDRAVGTEVVEVREAHSLLIGGGERDYAGFVAGRGGRGALCGDRAYAHVESAGRAAEPVDQDRAQAELLGLRDDHLHGAGGRHVGAGGRRRIDGDRDVVAAVGKAVALRLVLGVARDRSGSAGDAVDRTGQRGRVCRTLHLALHAIEFACLDTDRDGPRKHRQYGEESQHGASFVAA